MNAQGNGENWVVIRPPHIELGPQVPAMVGNQSLMLHAHITVWYSIVSKTVRFVKG